MKTEIVMTFSLLIFRIKQKKKFPNIHRIDRMILKA